MDQKIRDLSPQAGAAPFPPPNQNGPVARLPYVKPQVTSDHAPLLALLSSQCDLDATPNAG